MASHNSSLPSWLNSTSLKWDLGTADDFDQDLNILVRRSLIWAIILSIILLYVCAATKPWKNKTNILNLILCPFSYINSVLLTVFFELSVGNIFAVLDVIEKHNGTHLVLKKRSNGRFRRIKLILRKTSSNFCFSSAEVNYQIARGGNTSSVIDAFACLWMLESCN